MTALVRCTFYLRSSVDGGYRYKMISLKGYGNDGALHTEHPPMIGDIVPLIDADSGLGVIGRVIDRQWGHNQYGSTNWPITEQRPVQPDMLTLIVTEESGVFRDEAPLPEEEEEE